MRSELADRARHSVGTVNRTAMASIRRAVRAVVLRRQQNDMGEIDSRFERQPGTGSVRQCNRSRPGDRVVVRAAGQRALQPAPSIFGRRCPNVAAAAVSPLDRVAALLAAAATRSLARQTMGFSAEPRPVVVPARQTPATQAVRNWTPWQSRLSRARS